MKRTNHLITLEWNEGENYVISAWCDITDGEMESLVEDTEEFSTYAHADYEEFDSEKNFRERLDFFRRIGAEVTIYKDS